ncbi:MAG: hypothetical protein AAGA69_02160 [Pseudomonadota bacterium]
MFLTILFALQLFNDQPALADTTWPIYHANTRATASVPGTGPGDVIRAQSVPSLTNSRRRPNVSPWTVMGEVYADGSQPVITTPNNGVAKYLIENGMLKPVHFLPLDREILDFDWGIMLLEGGIGVTTEQKRDRFVVFGDEIPGDPYSPLEIKKTIPVDRARYGALTAHMSLAPDGHMIALTDAGKLIAIDLIRGRVIADTDLPSGGGVSFHNSFPIDETGRIYLAAQAMVAAIDWTGGNFSLAWTAVYDMRGPGCENVDNDRPLREEAISVARGQLCTGSGTTPTLLGGPREGVLVLVDGHAPQNNLVAFWRDQPPTDWKPLTDPTGRTATLDRQVAGVFALPYSTPEGQGYTAENSPAAYQYGVVVAQWAGFRPKRRSPKGVQRVDWNPSARRFELRWANPRIHYNGVPTIACQRGRECRTYGMGRYGRDYAYVSLDFETGRETARISLGRDDAILDQGNNHAVAADGSIVYSGRYEMVRVE